MISWICSVIDLSGARHILLAA